MNEQIEKFRELATTTETSWFDGRGNVTEQHFNKEKFAQLIIKQCGYYADVFNALGCPSDMDATETKPSDYINRNFGIEKCLPSTKRNNLSL